MSNSSVPPRSKFQLGLTLFTRGHGKQGAGCSGHSHEPQHPQQQFGPQSPVAIAQPSGALGGAALQLDGTGSKKACGTTDGNFSSAIERFSGQIAD